MGDSKRSKVDVAIIGGSAAGHAAANEVARRTERSVLLVHEEPGELYQRTKVSKTFAEHLSTATSFPPTAFTEKLKTTHWDSSRIRCVTGTRAESIDVERRTITLSDDSEYEWGALIVATGARPAYPVFENAVYKDVHFGTSKAEIERLRGDAGRGKQILVVGTGVLGVEVAEQLVKLAADVTLVGRGATLMSHDLNAEVGAQMNALFVANDVSLRMQDEVSLIQKNGEKSAVTFKGDATTHLFDAVVCATGVKPNTELAKVAHLPVNPKGGILVDQKLRVLGQEQIYAAGDVAEHIDRPATHLWRHAKEQGVVAGRNAGGANESYEFAPFRLKTKLFDHYFFSLCRFHHRDRDRFEEVKYSVGRGSMWAYYDKSDTLQGVMMVNDPEREQLYRDLGAHQWKRSHVEAAIKSV